MAKKEFKDLAQASGVEATDKITIGKLVGGVWKWFYYAPSQIFRLATATDIGGIKAAAKTAAETSECKIGADGKMYSVLNTTGVFNTIFTADYIDTNVPITINYIKTGKQVFCTLDSTFTSDNTNGDMVFTCPLPTNAAFGGAGSFVLIDLDGFNHPAVGQIAQWDGWKFFVYGWQWNNFQLQVGEQYRISASFTYIEQ